MESDIPPLLRHKKAASAVALLFMATLLGGILNFGVHVLLARALGVGDFGAFASSLALVALVMPIAGFGVSGYWLNAYGREGWGAQRWLPASFQFLLVTSSIAVTSVLAWAWFGPHDRHIATLLMFLSTTIIGQVAVEVGSAKYQIEGRPGGLALWQLLPHLLRFGSILILFVVIDAPTLTSTHAAVMFAIVATILAALGGFQLSLLRRGEFALEGHKKEHQPTVIQKHLQEHPSILTVMSATWPFGLAGFFYLVYFQSDIILIKYLLGETPAGIYNVAFVLMAAVYLFPSVLYQRFLLPKLHRWAHHDRRKLMDVYRVGNAAMAFLGALALFAMWVVTPYLLPWLFGAEYREALPIVAILALAIPFRFLATSAGAILTTRDYMQLKVKLMGITALINVVFNLFWIPMYGLAGAAAATVLSDVVLCILYVIYSRHSLQAEAINARSK